jgi:hypothetical protein
MATKSRTLEAAEGWEVQTSAPPAPAPIIEDDEDSILERLRSTQGEERDRMKVKVYRKVPGGTGLEWCTDYTVAEWEEGDVARVRQEWGPGNYELRVVSQGKRGILLRDHFRIAQVTRPEPLPAPAPVAQSSELADVVRMLAEGQQRILEAVSQRPDPAAQLQSTLGLMVAMREAMGLNTPPPPPPPAADPGAMLGQLVGAIRTLREVSAEVAPPEPDTSNPLAMLPQVLDLVKTGMSRGQNPAEMPPVQPLTIPSSLADSEPQGEPVGILVLRGQLSKLIEMAKANADPAKGGEFVADNLPEEMLPHLTLPNYFDILATFHGGVKAHREWFDKARDHAVRLLAEDNSKP